MFPEMKKALKLQDIVNIKHSIILDIIQISELKKEIKRKSKLLKKLKKKI